MNWTDFCDQIPGTKTLPIEAHTGTGAYGELYAAAVNVSPCVVDHTRRLVKTQTADAAGGVVVSSTTVFCPPDTVAPAKSRVTLPDGSVALVLSSSLLDDHDLELPSHVELALE